MNNNHENFNAKLKAMRTKWRAVAQKDEYQETRIISPYLFNKSKFTPLNISILSDNLNCFSNNYLKEYGDNLLKPLMIACLSGSRNIADFLLEKLDKTYVSEGFDFVLTYAAASFNTEWVKEIASKMAEANLNIPDHIFSVSSPGMVEIILECFRSASPRYDQSEKNWFFDIKGLS